MDLRNLPESLNTSQRCEERRRRVEKELKLDLSLLKPNPDLLGAADSRNCENMVGHVPLPVGIAGPIGMQFSSEEEGDVYLPLATTEGALVASVSRGCKALSQSEGVRTTSQEIGITRSICFKMSDDSKQDLNALEKEIHSSKHEWTVVGESTSAHLKIIDSAIDLSTPYLYLTLYGATGEAMGMNMITIAAGEIGRWISEHLCHGEVTIVTIAGNVDSDKKPSRRTHEEGRGIRATAEVTLDLDIIKSTLKTTPEAMLEVTKGKLHHGSALAGALSSNLHAANTIAALYLALGQDAAHIVEGSLTDTSVEISPPPKGEGQGGGYLKIQTHIPALLLGTVGGGTSLPAQSKCLDLILKPETTLPPREQLAQSIAAAVLAGEVSLLAAQSSQDLAKAHKKLARNSCKLAPNT